MFLTTFFAVIQRWHRCRKDIRLLSGFSDHELRDIGLARGSIREAVWHGR